MPNRTIYIRKDDIDKWDAIESKPEWLHEQLNHIEGNLYSNEGIAAIGEQFYNLGTKSPIFNGAGFVQIRTNGRSVPETLKQDYCEHYQLKGTCMVKGCKYGKGKK